MSENEVQRMPSMQERAVAVWLKLITGSTGWRFVSGVSATDSAGLFFEDRTVLGADAAAAEARVFGLADGTITISVNGKVIYSGPAPAVSNLQRLRVTVERVERADINVMLPEGNVLDHDSIWRIFNSTATDLACDQVRWEPARSYKLVGVCNDPGAPPPRVCFLVHP